MTCRLWLAVVLLFGVPAPSVAQDVLTYDRATALAVSQNPSIRAARAAADRAAADVTAVRARWFPRLSFVESMRRGDQPVFVFSSLLSAQRFEAANFGIDALNRPDSLNVYQRTFGIDEVLFDFGRTRAAVHVAEGRRDVADMAIGQTAATIVVAVANAYGRALAADASARAARSAVTTAEEDLVRAEHRRDAGTATDADVLSMQAHLSSMRERVILASADATISRAELNRLMGAPIDAPFSVDEPPLTQGDAAATLLAHAEANRPELAAARAAQRMAEAQTLAARADRLPQFAAQAAVDQVGLSFGVRAATWIAGVEMRWSLSLGGAEAARARGAAADLARARAEADDVKASVDADVITALARVQSARARMDASRSAIGQARASQRIIRDRYDAGLAAVTDLLRASTALLDAETARVVAVADALSADAALDRAVGRFPLPLR